LASLGTGAWLSPAGTRALAQAAAADDILGLSLRMTRSQAETAGRSALRAGAFQSVEGVNAAGGRFVARLEWRIGAPPAPGSERLTVALSESGMVWGIHRVITFDPSSAPRTLSLESDLHQRYGNDGPGTVSQQVVSHRVV